MLGYEDNWLISRAMFLIPLILCLGVHEWAHAWSAWKLGDDTARHLNRLTLNPLAHIDPVGTLLLPLLGVPFGWAKPVPFNPMRFNRRVSITLGSLLVAAAGPVSNLLLALGCLALMFAGGAFVPQLLSEVPAISLLLQNMVLLNVILAVFNLLPIPPLDGSYVAEALMPKALRPAWDALASVGPMALLAVLLLPVLFGCNMFAWPISAAQELSQAVLR